MNKIIFTILTALVISFSPLAIAAKGDTSFRLNLGYSDGTSFDTIEGDEFILNEDSTGVENDGVYTAELSKGNPTVFYGLGVNYSQTDHLDFNFAITRYKQTFGDQDVKLTKKSTGAVNTHFFPEFDIKGYFWNLGVSYKFTKAEIEKISYYAGMDAVYFSGTITNTNLNYESVVANNGNIIGSDYGKGGTSSITIQGYMPKFGVIYPLDEKITIGAEYGIMKFYDIDAGDMRSFMNGFTGDNGSADRLTMFVDYKF